ncbi:MAG: alpha/beta fold hydrolase [Phycisphaerae bacterium]
MQSLKPGVWSLVAVTALTVSTTATSLNAGGPTPLIPRHILFGNPDRSSVQLSHDGTKLSYIAPVNGVLNVWVGPADKPDAAKPVTKDTYRGIRSYFWAYTNNHVIYTQDKGGDENFHIYSVDLKTGKEIDLTPFDGARGGVLEVNNNFPSEILVQVNNRNPQLFDVHRVNITNGDRSVVYENNEGYIGFLTEDDMKVHFAVKMTPDGGSQVFRTTGDNQWTLFTSIPGTDALTTNPLGMDKSKENLYMLDSRGRNTAALTKVSLNSGDASIMAEHAKADIQGIIGHPVDKTIQAVQANYTRREWQILDPSIEGDLQYLKNLVDGEFNIGSRTLDDKHWIVSYVMDDGPVRYYHYDRSKKNAKFLFTNRASLEDVKLAKMHPVVVDARDGKKLVCYYTLPTWMDTDENGKPSEALPMVLLVHGGPWARDSWGYNPMHQWLANRGYAVMSVNFRGSTGFGKDFINAGNFEWAGKMHDDLLDAVDWAVKNKVALRDKVGIMGGSYGGYATLVGLTYTPKKFACGVDIVGPSNLVTLLNTIPPYWKPMIDMFTQRVGDHRTEDGAKLLEERSPLNYVDRIERPLLIAQGANDPRVKQSESDQIVTAMQNKNIPVSYVLFPDEGHGFARPENRMSFNAVTEAFLSKHLGGRFEPMSEDITGSTITVPAGASLIPGLPAAVPTTAPAKGDPT